jgi:hypothetical protein
MACTCFTPKPAPQNYAPRRLPTRTSGFLGSAAVSANAADFLKERARKGAFGVRQLAAALKHGLMQIIAINWAIHKGASKLCALQGLRLRQKVCGSSRLGGIGLYEKTAVTRFQRLFGFTFVRRDNR